jgi:hypothetical protein
MKSPEELRAEARRLTEKINNIAAPQLKIELASRALALSERAEAIEISVEDPQIAQMNIMRYQSWLSGGLTDEAHRKNVEEALTDAEECLLCQDHPKPR